MPNRVAVTRAMPAATTPGATFKAELRSAMWRRARAVLAVGVAISALMNVLARYVLQRPQPLDTPYTLLIPNVYLAYIAIFGFGLLLVWRDWWTARTVALIVLAIWIASGLLDVSLTAVLYPIAATVASAVVPEVSAFWEAQTETSLGQVILDQAIAVGVLAAVSVYITRTLYTMRRELHAASRLGNYVIEGELGKGGMGKVYRARHAMIRRPTAIKVMEADAGRSPEALGRFEREVQLSATLSHPNTITIFDFGRSEDATFYYAMEYLEGMDLHRMVERFGPVPPERAVYILRQACGSLAEAHSRSIIHRDLKPSNIFLTERGGQYDFVKVLDFGLAKQTQSSPDDVQLTQAGSVFGTPLFMAPETAAEAVVDHRTDQYSIGCVAYWMLAGEPPFQGTSPYDVIAKHLKIDPKPPSEVSELRIPAELDAVVLRCLAKSPGDRFGNMDEVREALDAIQFDEPWSGRRAGEWWALHLPREDSS
jgi:serine/threonine-protein kinase